MVNKCTNIIHRSLFIFFGNTNFFKFEFKTVAPDSIEDRLLGIIPDNGNEEVYVSRFENFIIKSPVY